MELISPYHSTILSLNVIVTFAEELRVNRLQCRKGLFHGVALLVHLFVTIVRLPCEQARLTDSRADYVVRDPFAKFSRTSSLKRVDFASISRPLTSSASWSLAENKDVGGFTPLVDRRQ